MGCRREENARVLYGVVRFNFYARTETLGFPALQFVRKSCETHICPVHSVMNVIKHPINSCLHALYSVILQQILTLERRCGGG